MFVTRQTRRTRQEKWGCVIVNVWNEANEANETSKIGVCDCKCLERGKRGKRDNEKGEGSLSNKLFKKLKTILLFSFVFFFQTRTSRYLNENLVSKNASAVTTSSDQYF